MKCTCAILSVSSRQNCRGHIMHHHDTFHKMLPPPAWHAYKQYRPGAENNNREPPRPGAKKKRPSRREQKIQPPGPGAEKTQPPRPVPPRKKKTTAPSRLGKQIQPPRPASEKKTTAPSRFGGKKRPPRPASKKKQKRPVPPRISTPIFCQSRAPAEMKKVGQPAIFPPSRPVEILAVYVKP